MSSRYIVAIYKHLPIDTIENINHGYLGFGSLNILPLPNGWYRNFITTYLGFPMPGFHSSDYLSLLPWVFLYAAGSFGCALIGGNFRSREQLEISMLPGKLIRFGNTGENKFQLVFQDRNPTI